MNLINSLFSSFDPIRGTLFSNYIILALIIVLPLSINIFIVKQRTAKIRSIVIRLIERELNTSIANKNKEGKRKILLVLFLIIIFLNVIGLMPYVFTITAQIAFTLSIALPFWLGFVLFSINKNTSNFLAHIVPRGTPIALSQFMTLIETVSQIIRPITLSVRLAANITAGHILIALSRASIIIFNHIRIVLIILLILEIAVAFIQRYVFVILITIYLRETN